MSSDPIEIAGEPGAYRIERQGVFLEWARLGEGRMGDYDPDDPEDVELLRFDVSRRTGDGWEPCRGGSYCTQMPAESPPEVQKAALRALWDMLGEEVVDTGRVSGAEAASWIGPWWDPVLTRVVRRMATGRVRDLFAWYVECNLEGAVTMVEMMDDEQRDLLAPEDLLPC